MSYTIKYRHGTVNLLARVPTAYFIVLLDFALLEAFASAPSTSVLRVISSDTTKKEKYTTIQIIHTLNKTAYILER